MKIYDLSLTFEPKEKVEALGVEIIYRSHAEGGKEMMPIFACQEEDLPGGGGWTVRKADPLHARRHARGCALALCSVSGGKKSPLHRLDASGVVLRRWRGPGHAAQTPGAAITTADLKAALKKIKYTLKAGDIVCLQTRRRQTTGASASISMPVPAWCANPPSGLSGKAWGHRHRRLGTG